MSIYAKSPAPHIRSQDSVLIRHWTIIASLLPAWITTVFLFGLDALRLFLWILIAALLSEYLGSKLFQRRLKLIQARSVVTAFLLFFLMPASLPGWMAVTGTFFAVFIGCELFGGLGSNNFHAAVLGRAFLQVSFPNAMSWPAMAEQGSQNWILAVFLFAGGLVLIQQKRIYWELPLLHMIMLLLLSSFAGQNFLSMLGGGSLILVSFYIIPDGTTTPLTRYGKRSYAVLAALLCALLSPFWASYATNIVFVILIMNASVPWLDKWVHEKWGTARVR